MDRLKTTVFTAFVIAILFTPAAFAQPLAANITVVSGNGQMICPTCGFSSTFTIFYPMVVKVTDASGNPIANKTVNWNLVSAGSGQLPNFDSTTITDRNGLSVARLFQSSQSGSYFLPYLQSVITATADNVTVNFYETMALSSSPPFNVQIVFTRLDAPNGTPLTGPAGSTGTSPIKVHVDGNSVPVPNVSLRILSPDPKAFPSAPSASCATGAGADPGSVFTDANGDATCYPVFGPVAGSGPVQAMIGGLDPAEFDQTITVQPLLAPIAYFGYGGIQLVVTPVTPGLVTIVSGNNQSVDPGKAAAPLVVKVTDGSGTVPIGNTNVQWTISPAGMATASPTQSSTNPQGQAQTTVTFSPSASGQVTVRAALTGSNSGISSTFTLSTNVLIFSITKVSGDLQTAQSGLSFAAPLVVQVIGTNGQPLSNQPVSFVVNGSATLSELSVLTDAGGMAKVTVTAGATPGPLTVSAIVGSITQTFTLTVGAPAPTLSNGSFYNAGGATRIGALAPCGLVTVLSSGLAPNVQGMVFNTSGFGPWATTLASDTVTVNGVAAPIYSVGNVSGVEQLTFQVPCETALGNAVPIAINVAGGQSSITFPVAAASPGVLETVMSDGVRRAVAVRPDGSFVSLQNPANPARRAEVVRVFVTGLGPAIPAVGTGALPVPGADSLAQGQVIVGVANSGTQVVTVRLSPNLIGVYEVTFKVPDTAPTGNDVVLSVAVNASGDSQTRFSNGSKLPIQ